MTAHEAAGPDNRGPHRWRPKRQSRPRPKVVSEGILGGDGGFLRLKDVSHEDLSRHHCVDWLKAHEAHFSRVRMLETADLTGIPLKSIIGPINYRPLKLLGSPRLIVEPPKHQTSRTRIRVATPAQLRVVDKLLESKDMGLRDAPTRAQN